MKETGNFVLPDMIPDWVKCRVRLLAGKGSRGRLHLPDQTPNQLLFRVSIVTQQGRKYKLALTRPPYPTGYIVGYVFFSNRSHIPFPFVI